MLHITGHDITLAIRAVDPPSFLADPDPAVILNTDPDPAVFFLCGSGSSLKKLVKNYLKKSYLELKNTKKIAEM